MKYVIGVDLGTSAVKVILVDQLGQVHNEVSKSYPLIHPKSSYNEQDPEEWVKQTVLALKEIVQKSNINTTQIEGMSFSGQMHGLVVLNQEKRLLRNAILWNDTRATEQCTFIKKRLGSRLLDIMKNIPVEADILPKLLWVKQHEPDVFRRIHYFMLPKDYLRFRLTGEIHCEYTDASGTLLLDIMNGQWSEEICQAFGIQKHICPPLVSSHTCVGTLLPEIATETGLTGSIKVFAGAGDNACGAIGSGVVSKERTLCSIGTSGVILAYEEQELDYEGKLLFYHHGKQNAYYAMGVTLAAGYSLNWFRRTFAPETSYEELLKNVHHIPIGANGLLYTPYLVGERTPHADAVIRGSLTGLDGTHRRDDILRALLEGVTFSLNEIIHILRDKGKSIRSIVSIGGGAKNETWLQMQADIFNTKVIQLESQQGAAMGAAMLAAYGCGWFHSLDACSEAFIKPAKQFIPQKENVEKYKELFYLYQKVYTQTKEINTGLKLFRKA